jgi:hypothetical protein
VAVLTASASTAAEESVASERIRDNLFLLEEAYNQEPGVIQHISVFQYSPRAATWTFTFTEEWPVPNDLNQLSVQVNLGGSGSNGPTGFQDTLLNYRIQALGLGGKGWIAMAPRFSLVLPTGNPRKAMGHGSIGVQLNLAISMELGPYFAVHLDAGATVTPSAQSPAGRTETALDANAGVALVWQPLTWCNPLVEVSYTVTEEVGDASNQTVHRLVVSPGARFAINHPKTRLQVVLGIAAPLQVLPRGKFESAVLTYLSFEHPAF